MCGFCGFTGQVKEREVILNKMMDKIIHRGPDSSGVHSTEEVSFGFRRLSIIGLEDGSQPMYNEDKSMVLVFNGEIYNYQSLKEALIQKGHIFSSHADSEVLLHLYEEHGEKMLDYLRGMFSFVIWNDKEKTLFGARDFFGIKPFYYGQVNGNVVFGSEIKSILEYPLYKKELNETALENYLTFQYSVLDETFFKGIYKLKPAHYILLKDGEVSIKRYWQPSFDEKKDTLQNTIKEIDDVIQESIKMHKISDVEVGSFLSSGVDSSYVAACFQGDKTFTVGFDYDKYNEIEYAKALSDKINIKNHNKTITTEEYWNTISKVQYQMDEPLADPSAIALYFVSQLASKHVKVALSGEGADEFFGGYNIYKEPIDLSIVTDLPLFLRKIFAKIVSFIPFSFRGKNFFIRASKKIEERFIGNAFMFTQKEREAILKNPSKQFSIFDITKPYYDKVSDKDDITKMQFIDINLWMVGDILLKADKMSMAHSLEVRVPFLDKEVFKVASKIPVNFRVNKTGTKYAFRMAANRHLPDDVANKKKLGFPTPIRIWLKEDKYNSKVKKAFSGSVAEKYFNKDILLNLLEEHKLDKKDNSRKIWTVYMFLVWHEQYFA